jgi:hypothetical protein
MRRPSRHSESCTSWRNRKGVRFWLFFLPALAAAQDFQVWNEVDLAATWRNVDFLVPLVVRTDTKLPNPLLAAAGITAEFPLPWSLTVTGGYLFADLPRNSLLVQLPLVAITKRFPIGRFRAADRNRFEKLIGYPGSPVRFRNRLSLDRPFGAHDRWHIFTADEIFFNLSTSSWNQNRFQAGTGARLNNRVFFDIYYLQRNPNGGVTTHALGTTLRISVTRP